MASPKSTSHDHALKLIQDLADKGRSGARAICFFNNKGGVGKTTLVANLAAQLALNLNQRILVVDADPQCNLTQYVLTDNEFEGTYGGLSATGTIYDVIHPLSIGKGYSRDLPIRKVPKFGFDAIIGDPRLALKEDLLAQDWRDAKAGGTRGLRTTFLFSNLIDRAAEHYDFIFFDMGPSLGAINRSILLSADHFVVPMSIDIFSLWAIKNIGQALGVWQTELANGIRFAEDPSELPRNRLKGRNLGFLGYVTQQHKEKSENKVSRVVEAYNAIKTKLPHAVASVLKSYFPSPTFDPHLGDIKHLASLAPKSQTLHTPMITVTLKGSYTVTRSQARKIYESIAERFFENLLAVEAKSKASNS
ncbi:ParA family protein [Rhizobacter sp. OV335]|jgi:cellulose biosynthesis protein BcsQ|uniref:ParA family protein n=1 Tax=Rhizobacter sp. OV335 TaxID=1500264 RepID=UPI000922FFEC|nr:AAA family ATPase [Rhizobacter sp. OV335]SHM15497.1 CobQ/CobB/MinD/ParA nucleotide binding domain-containing protein [Rhizobacter sp. OV335]